jgi:hypothetical protein
MTIIRLPQMVSIPIAVWSIIKVCTKDRCSIVLCGGASFRFCYVPLFSCWGYMG